MNSILIDSNVLIDLFSNNPDWADWSQEKLDQYSHTHRLTINPVIYSEVSIGFQKIEKLDAVIKLAGIRIQEIPQAGLFLAGKAFLNYRKNSGTKLTTLPDFFIGAHAAVEKIPLLTRDVKRVHTYFPTVKTIAP